MRVHVEAHRDLLRRLYEAASIDPRADGTFALRAHRRPAWALDLRRPLLRSELLQPAAAAVTDRLLALGATQVAGLGLGAAPLVCGVVAQARGVDGALLRAEPKRRNFIRPFEGELAGDQPVWLLDDLVNSGRSGVAAAAMLRQAGLQVDGVVCLFRFGWGAGQRRLRAHGLRLEPLAELQRPSPSGALERRLRALVAGR